MSKMTVLIIEDDDVAAEILQHYMERCLPRAKIEWCWDGFQALVIFEKIKPNIILLDYMMPKIDGLEFLDQMNKLNPDHKSYIIVISAYVDEKMQKDFLKRGAYQVLPKPITFEKIQPVIEKVKKEFKTKKQ